MTPVYFQIQYPGVHSDGCAPLTADFREFAHQLLDEFFDNYEQGQGRKPDEGVLDGAHVVFAPCSEHSE